ncbi:MAG TPA: hypothetical protein PLF26_20975, partial [Blastocatellia bacterium]|nr:hypothetical protein [Blastocatellia bacterium]
QRGREEASDPAAFDRALERTRREADLREEFEIGLRQAPAASTGRPEKVSTAASRADKAAAASDLSEAETDPLVAARTLELEAAEQTADLDSAPLAAAAVVGEEDESDRATTATLASERGRSRTAPLGSDESGDDDDAGAADGTALIS